MDYEGQLSAQQRAARVAWRLAQGERLSTRTLEELTGLGRSGVLALMTHLAAWGGVPVRQEEDGCWAKAE